MRCEISAHCHNQLGEQRCDHQRRQQVSHWYLLDLQQTKAHAHQKQAAGRRQSGKVSAGEKLSDQRAHYRQRALYDGDRQCRCCDAPPERGSESDGCEPVERGLQDEQVGSVAEPVRQRAENGERAYAEEQGRRDEPLNETLPFARSTATDETHLKPTPDSLQAIFDPEQRPGDSAYQQGSQDDQHGRGCANCLPQLSVGDREDGQGGDEQRDETERIGDDVAGSRGETVTEQNANPEPTSTVATFNAVPNPRNIGGLPSLSSSDADAQTWAGADLSWRKHAVRRSVGASLGASERRPSVG